MSIPTYNKITLVNDEGCNKSRIMVVCYEHRVTRKECNVTCGLLKCNTVSSYKHRSVDLLQSMAGPFNRDAVECVCGSKG